MGKMAEIDYENEKKDVDGTEGVVDLKKEMKPKKKEIIKITQKPKIVKKEENVKEKQTNNDTKRLEQIESNLETAGKTIDKLNDSIKRISSLLNQVANRMGLK